MIQISISADCLVIWLLTLSLLLWHIIHVYHIIYTLQKEYIQGHIYHTCTYITCPLKQASYDYFEKYVPALCWEHVAQYITTCGYASRNSFLCIWYSLRFMKIGFFHKRKIIRCLWKSLVLFHLHVWVVFRCYCTCMWSGIFFSCVDL